MTDIVIEPFDFSSLADGYGHVMIHVNIGNMPHQRVTSYLDHIRKVTPICQHLNDLGIQFSVVPMREKVETEVVQTIAIEVTDGVEESAPEDVEAVRAYDRARL